MTNRAQPGTRARGDAENSPWSPQPATNRTNQPSAEYSHSNPRASRRRSADRRYANFGGHGYPVEPAGPRTGLYHARLSRLELEPRCVWFRKIGVYAVRIHGCRMETPRNHHRLVRGRMCPVPEPRRTTRAVPTWIESAELVLDLASTRVRQHHREGAAMPAYIPVIVTWDGWGNIDVLMPPGNFALISRS